MSALHRSGRFIVSTGRAGSTLLSDLLSRHPAVLSLSEVFSGVCSDPATLFPTEWLTGPEMWEVVGSPRPHTLRAAVVDLLRLPEVEPSVQPAVPVRAACAGPPVPDGLACLGDAASQPEAVLEQVAAFLREVPGEDDRLATVGGMLTTIPPPLLTSLLYLTGEPEALNQEVGAFVRTLPRADIGTQYSQVFGWLCERFGRSVWVERGALSTRFAAELVRWWPDGHFVHLVRDGRAAAVSMSGNLGFSIPALVNELRRNSGGLGLEELLTAAVGPGAPPVPVERFGELWSEQVVATSALLAAVPPERVMVLRYEDLAREPARELRRLVGFLGVGDQTPESWVASAAAPVYDRRPAWLDLAVADRARLEAACRPGLQVLGYV